MRRTPLNDLTVATLLSMFFIGCAAMDETSGSKPGAKVTIVLVTSATPKPGDIARVKAVVSGTSYLPGSYSWSVDGPGTQVVAIQKDDKAGQGISFKITAEGTYKVYCEVKLQGIGTILKESTGIQAVDPSAVRLTYTVRVLPPVTSSLPPSEHTIKVGSVSQELLTWSVAAGEQVALRVQDKAKTAIAANVRLTRSGTDPLPRDIFLPSGVGSVRLSGVFHALFIPLTPPGGTDLAPLLRPYIKAGDLSGSWAVTVDPGLLVAGTVRGASGSPLAGARVSLLTRDSAGVDVPSTVATADQAGGFKVRARAGKASLTVVPPSGSGLSSALVQGASLQVLANSSGWAFTYNKADMVQVQASALASDGSSPAAGAVALFTLTQGAGSVGKLVLTSGGTFKADPLARYTLVADVKGVLRSGSGGGAKGISLPRGKYTVALWPGSGAAGSEGYREVSLDLTGATGSGPKLVQLKLAPRVKVSGKIMDGSGKPVIARITASSSGGTFQAVAGQDGKFSLDLDDGLEYRLVARALGSDALSGTLVKPAVKVSGKQELGSLSLPPAVVISGKVQTAGQMGLAGALIRVWCSDPSCSSTALVDETSTLADGTFQLRLPTAK